MKKNIWTCSVKFCNKSRDLPEIYCWDHLVEYYKNDKITNRRLIDYVEDKLSKMETGSQ